MRPTSKSRLEKGLVWGALVVAVLGVASAQAQTQTPAPTGTATPATPSVDSWFAQIKPGMFVKAEGALDPHGGLRAEKFKIVLGELDESEVTTTIVRVDAEHRTIETALGVRVVTDRRSELQGKQGAVAFTSLEPGDQIEAEGQLQRDGTLLASEIEIRPPKPAGKPPEESEISGKIESVDQRTRTFVVLGTTVHVDENTKNQTRIVH